MGPDALFVRVQVRVGPDGIVRWVEADGHAGASKAGANVACAAVSVLLLSAYETMAQYEGVDVSGRAGEPGALSFALKRFPTEAAPVLRGASDFLLVGLSGVEREYPGTLKLDIRFDGGN